MSVLFLTQNSNIKLSLAPSPFNKSKKHPYCR